MAKTYNTFTNVSTGDVYTAASHNAILQNLAGYRVPPMARISGTSMTGITDGVQTLVTGMTTVNFDTDSMTGTANRITVGTAGVYLVGGYGNSDSGTQSNIFFGLSIARYNSADALQETYGLDTRTTNVGYGNTLTPVGLFSASVGDYFRLTVNIDGDAAGTRTLNVPRLWATWQGQVS